MTWPQKIAWFGKWYPLALATEKKYGVPALVTLAQHVWEWGWIPPHNGFNIFGVKPWWGWKGRVGLQDTWEVESTPNVKYPKIYSITKRPDGKYYYKIADYFCQYDSAQQAYDEHGHFIKANPTYTKHGCFVPGIDANTFADRLAAAGYATDPDYAHKLRTMIHEFSGPDFVKKQPASPPVAVPASSPSPASGGGSPAPPPPTS